jgi:phosphatidate cytidylyltransferase
MASNLLQRFGVAVVAVPIVLLTLHVSTPEPTWVLVFAATLLAAREFFGMTLADKGDRIASLIIAGASAAALYWLHPYALHTHKDWAVKLALDGPMIAFILAVIPTGLYYLFRFREIPTVAARFTATVTGTVYVALTMTFLALCKRDWDKGADVVVLILLIAWVGDTGAYFAGRFLGKKKLYEAVSPKKTWAGAWGGLAGSLAGSIVMKVLFLHELSWIDIVLIAVPGAILGQLGDLAESLFKRAVGVKDSGSLLPGHGGMLDRVDAVLFIAPYVYLYIQLFGHLAPRV